jgi:glutathione S-transferase
MVTLYDYLESGNAYKVRLLLQLLGLPFRRVELDILKRETRTPEFLAKNPNGRIPAVELDDGRVLFESNAILWYFAEDTALAGRDAWERAQILQWMCFEQYSHEPNIATARFIVRYLGNPPERREALAAKMAPGYAALGVMEGHLAAHDWFAGGACSIADIALYAYTHCAGEGGFDLGRYPAIRSWLARVESQPFHVPMG